MAKDYKHRAQADQRRRRSKQSDSVGVVKWMLITALIIGFAVFLVYIRSAGKDAAVQIQPITPPPQPVAQAKTPEPAQPAKPEKVEPKGPTFEFYRLLPGKEVTVPEHEINSRIREEQTSKTKDVTYVLQIAAFDELTQADALKAKLALLNFQTKIEKAKLGNTYKYRVRIGPAQIADINNIKNRLKQQGIDSMILSISK